MIATIKTSNCIKFLCFSLAILLESKPAIAEVAPDIPVSVAVKIVSQASGQVISLSRDSLQEINTLNYLVTESDRNRRYQRWYLEPCNNDGYKIRSAYNGKYVSFDTGNRNRLYQGQGNEVIWTLIKVSNGIFTIKDSQTSKVWDESGAIEDHSSNLKPVLLYNNNGDTNQHFIIISDPSIVPGSFATTQEMAADRAEIAHLKAKDARELRMRAIGTWQSWGNNVLTIYNGYYDLWDEQSQRSRSGAWDINDKGQIVLYGANGRAGDLIIYSINGNQANTNWKIFTRQ